MAKVWRTLSPSAFLLHWALSDEKYPVLSPRRLSSTLCGLGEAPGTARPHGQGARPVGTWAVELRGERAPPPDGGWHCRALRWGRPGGGVGQ